VHECLGPNRLPLLIANRPLEILIAGKHECVLANRA
jgi:hypothetical protein